MVSKPSTYLATAVITLVALQVQHATSSSLEYDPYTTCTSYDIGNKNFPGRGTEIEDDGTQGALLWDKKLSAPMVSKPSTYLATAVITLVALQVQHATSSSLEYDPYTTCTSYDIGNKNFPGRGTEIEDDGTCTVTIPEDPNVPKAATVSAVAVTHTELLSNKSVAPAVPVFTKVGTQLMSETPSTNPDAYATAAVSSTTPLTYSRRLEWTTSSDIASLEEYFGSTMELNVKKLPISGVYTPTPWAGSNWPTYLDSINFEWNKGERSPAEKYAMAFGLNVKNFMDNVSAQNG
ncbi:Transglutaminase elicitor-like protein, partial [Phytophthora palmivora]